MLARRQHGPVHRDQLVEVGLERWQIRYRLKVERLWEVHPLVYTVGLRELSDLGAWSAAVLAASPDAALASRSGGQFHGIVDRYKGPIEVVVPRKHPPRLKGVACRTARLGPFDVVTRRNIRVTSLPRTLLDLAGVLSEEELSQAFQKAMRLGLRFDHVADVIDRNPRAKGRRVLRDLVARHRDDDGFGRGGFENAFYPWLIAWLPKRHKVRRNVTIPFSDGIDREADFLIDDNVWIETDYHGHHGASREQATRDHQRDRAIRNAGYQLGRYTDHEFLTDRAAIKADIEELLLRAGCDGGADLGLGR